MSTRWSRPWWSSRSSRRRRHAPPARPAAPDGPARARPSSGGPPSDNSVRSQVSNVGMWTDERKVLVAFWRCLEDNQMVFAQSRNWKTVRATWEEVSDEIRPGADLSLITRKATEVFRGLTYLKVSQRTPVGLALASRLAPTPASFALIDRHGRWAACSGSDESVSALVAHADRRYVLRAVPYRQPQLHEKRIARRARTSSRAKAVLADIVECPLHRPCGREMSGLSSPELLWLGQEVRRANRIPRMFEIASILDERDGLVDACNLRSTACRITGALATAEQHARESVERCWDPHANAVGHLLLAVALRDLDERDEAYDHWKLARRAYPEDEYVVNVGRTLLRDPAWV